MQLSRLDKPRQIVVRILKNHKDLAALRLALPGLRRHDLFELHKILVPQRL